MHIFFFVGLSVRCAYLNLITCLHDIMQSNQQFFITTSIYTKSEAFNQLHLIALLRSSSFVMVAQKNLYADKECLYDGAVFYTVLTVCEKEGS